MRIGINTFLFASPFTTREVSLFPAFKSWGFDSVEMAIEDPAHVDSRLVREALSTHGLVAGSVSGAWGPGRDLRGSPDQQQASLDYTYRLMELLHEWECPTLIGPMYSCVGRASMVPPAERGIQWELVGHHLSRLAARAGELGITLCIEPLNRYETDFINTAEQALRMVKYVGSPWLKILLDTFHMNIEEKDPAQAIRQVGRHLGHLHACGCDRGTPGEDHIPWEDLAQALQETGYQGDVVVESFTPEVQVIAKAAAIWRPMAPSSEHIAREGYIFLRELFSRYPL